jgi:Zinc dependent phospholipase C
MRLLTAICLALVVVAAQAERPRAWGYDVHRLIMHRAIDLLPAEIKPFYEKNRLYLVEHSIDPDLWRNAGFTEEPPRHFVDLDAYGAFPFAALPREYDRAVEKYGVDFVTRNGLLPWRAAEIHGRLRRAFEQQKKGGPGYQLEDIKFFSAVLAHYVSDAHVPLHAVTNYDGQLTNQHGIHSRWETELVMRNQASLKLTPSVVAPVRDARTYAFDVLLASFPLAAKVLEADLKGIGTGDTYDDAYFATLLAETRPILEERLSGSISGIAAVIVGAWEEAGRPALPLNPPSQPRKRREARPATLQP